MSRQIDFPPLSSSPLGPQVVSASDVSTFSPPLIVLAVFSALVVSFAIILIVYKFHKKQTKTTTVNAHHYTYQELKAATNNFSTANLLGQGGFGEVFAGRLASGLTVAVKKLKKRTPDDDPAFWVELDALTKLRHKNIVLLHGYCAERNHRLFVYEYMPNGDLSRHLFSWREFTNNPLTWQVRVSIALDVSRALNYLKNEARDSCSFIHRNVKTENILLDQNMRAKVADFGFVYPLRLDNVATQRVGTRGHMAPEYGCLGDLNRLHDTFSFGIVLLELVTGQRALCASDPNDVRYLGTSSLDDILQEVDQALQGGVIDNADNIRTVAQLALRCATLDPSQRDSIEDAVAVLTTLAGGSGPALVDDDDDDDENIMATSDVDDIELQYRSPTADGDGFAG